VQAPVHYPLTTFNVEPRDGRSQVRISTSRDGASGISGFFERTFAPKVMRRIYLDELDRLNAYAAGQQ
jgi:Polyketide cyclase / dehydrase and lipid transport